MYNYYPFLYVYHKNCSSETFLNQIISKVKNRSVSKPVAWKFAHIKFDNPFEFSPNHVLMSAKPIFKDMGYLFLKWHPAFFVVLYINKKKVWNPSLMDISHLLMEFLQFLRSNFNSYIKNIILFSMVNNLGSIPPSLPTPKLFMVLKSVNALEICDQFYDLFQKNYYSCLKEFPYTYEIKLLNYTDTARDYKITIQIPHILEDIFINARFTNTHIIINFISQDGYFPSSKRKYLSYLLLDMANFMKNNFSSLDFFTLESI